MSRDVKAGGGTTVPFKQPQQAGTMPQSEGAGQQQASEPTAEQLMTAENAELKQMVAEQGLLIRRLVALVKQFQQQSEGSKPKLQTPGSV